MRDVRFTIPYISLVHYKIIKEPFIDNIKHVSKIKDPNNCNGIHILYFKKEEILRVELNSQFENRDKVEAVIQCFFKEYKVVHSKDKIDHLLGGTKPLDWVEHKPKEKSKEVVKKDSIMNNIDKIVNNILSLMAIITMIGSIIGMHTRIGFEVIFKWGLTYNLSMLVLVIILKSFFKNEKKR